MTEATGKGNCMSANIKSFKKLLLLILIGGLCCVPVLLAQEQDDQATSDDRHIKRLGEVSTDEWDMDLALPKAAPVADTGNGSFSLPDQQQNRQLQQLLSKLATDPGNTRTLAQLETLLSDVMRQANEMMVPDSFEQAQQILQLVQIINPEFQGLNTGYRRLKVLRNANELLISGNAAFRQQKYAGAGRDNALYFYRQTLRKDPANESAKQGIEKVQQALVNTAMETARDLDFDQAEEWLQEAALVQNNQDMVESARAELLDYRQQRALDLQQAAIEAMNSGKFTLADFNIIDLIAMGGQQSMVDSLRIRLKEARVYGGFEPGQVINDDFLGSDNQAPTIIVVAAGSFLMGSDDRSGGVNDSERPRHRVTIEQGFGMGIREVSVAQFRSFIEATGYRTAAERSGKSNIYHESLGRLTPREGITWEHTYSGRKAKPNMPVLHVNIYDAQAYVEWLANGTGKKYRLPSEAEYEFVARAGGNSTYWWGEGSPDEVVENLTGERDHSPGKRQWSTSFKKYGDGHWGPAPVGSVGEGKMEHPMGVQDIAGNVSEWTEDCWHQNYMKAPVDGSAWINPGCDRRVVRGGYWASAPAQSRAAFRISAKPDTYGPVVGFRVARDL